MKLLFGNTLTPLEILEFVLTAICLLVALVRPATLGGVFARIENSFQRLALHPWWAAATAGLLPLVIRGAMFPIYGTPSPSIHDEYGFLLQADTFASGRLTNPAHPMWRYFESIYILVKPTYTAQYQMAQGLALAAGKFVTGNPWVGVFVIMGVLCAVLYWMLRAWVPDTWALFGGLLAGFQFGVLTYWMNSYFGGTVAAIGGTLVLGALPRMRERPRISLAVLAAMGLAILMHSRPLEALVFLLVVCAALVRWVFLTREIALGLFARNIFAPFALILIASSAFLAFYNYRVTGHATELPYSVYRRTYGTPQGFYLQKPLIVRTFLQPEIRDEYEFQLHLHERRWSYRGLANSAVGKFRTFWGFYLGPALTVPLIFLPFIWNGRNMRLALGIAVIFALDYLNFFAFLPQYAAPVTGLVLLAVLLCWRHMRELGPRGLFLSRGLFVVVILGVAFPVLGRLVENDIPFRIAFLQEYWETEFADPFWRAIYLDDLQRQGGKHLVIVRYQHPGHDVNTEWVYNDADIDASKVVWARETAGQTPVDLLRHFAGRKVWLALPDAEPPRLEPYPDDRPFP